MSFQQVRKFFLNSRIRDLEQPFQSCLSQILSEFFPFKYRFVDLNGASYKAMGFRRCNNRLRYRNGMLGRAYDRFDSNQLTPLTKNIPKNSDFCREREIPFLLVLAPCKIDLQGELFPEGWQAENPNQAGMRVVKSLREQKVEVLNLIPKFAQTSEAIGRCFFETDHHWRFETALCATRMLVDRLADMLADASLKGQHQLKEKNWKWCDIGPVFLGSHGRRVGCFFGGFSRFRYCIPKFKTTICRKNLSLGKIAKGDFVKAEMWNRVLKIKDPYGANKYALYTGCDVGLQVHTNKSAPNDRRIMIVKDSFGDPVAAYLATVFKSVIQVDPRRLKEGQNVRALIQQYNPDVVVALYGASSLFDDEERRK